MSVRRDSRRSFCGRLAAAAGAFLSAPGVSNDANIARGGDRFEDATTDVRTQPFDELLSAFVAETGVRGAALAVTKGSRLVYARGCGLADRDRNIPVEPTSLFRIASLSKPITAVVVLRLVEQGRLSLDESIVPRLGLVDYLDPRWERITVRHLLQHTGGWDRDLSFDPMFRAVEIAEHLHAPPPAGPAEIIAYMLQQPLDFDPGSRYAYSNFGYCLLGRVIEAVTGLEYGEAVRQQVLAPLGIRAMRLGRTLRAAPGEVRYYAPEAGTAPAVRGDIGREVPHPYGAWNLEAMDAHGGWIASAVELVRFSSAVVDKEHSPLLSADAWEQMLAPPEGPAGHDEEGRVKTVYYGCGWNVRRVGEDGRCNFWHQGALPGTSTLLVCRQDGLSWAVLFNQRLGPGGERLASLIDPRLHQAAEAVSDWPEHDLFSRYLQL